MVEELIRGGGPAHAQGGRRRKRLGIADVLEYRFQRDGKGTQGSKRHCAKDWVAGGATLIFTVRKVFL